MQLVHNKETSQIAAEFANCFARESEFKIPTGAEGDICFSEIEFYFNDFNDLDSKKARTEFVYALLKDNREAIAVALYGHLTDDRGTIDHYSIEIDKDTVHFTSAEEGGFFVFFDEHVYNGCNDLDRHFDHENELSFEVKIGGILQVKGVSRPTRSTFDEL